MENKMTNLIYKINDKVTIREIVSFLTKMDRETRKELYFSVRDPYKEIKAIKNSDIITARTEQNDLVGITRIVSDKTYYFYITDVMVIPKMRNQGIATEMMKRAIIYCKKKGFIKIFLVPVKGLEKFYSKFGFKVSDYLQMVILQKGIHNG